MKFTNRNSFLSVLLFIIASGHCHREFTLNDISEIIRKGINDTINPCDDFYKYACGNWIKNYDIPSTANNWNVLEMSKATGYSMIRDMLEKGNINESNTRVLMEKRLYDACKGYSREEGRNLFQRMLFETENMNWPNIMQYYANKIGDILLFEITLSEKKYIQILSPLNVASTNQVQNMVNNKMLSNTMKLYNLLNNEALKESIDQLWTFATSVYELTVKTKQDISKMTISKLQKLYDNSCHSLNAKIDWLMILKNLAEGSRMNFTNTNSIYVDKAYIKGLCHILRNTSEYAIVNYLHYNFIMHDKMSTYVDVEFDDKMDSMRSISCVENLPLSDGIYDEFVKSYISDEINNMVTGMFIHLKAKLMEEIDNSWLLGPVRKQALKTVREIKFKYVARSEAYVEIFKDISYDFEIDPVGLQTLMNFKKAQMIKKINLYYIFHVLSRRKTVLGVRQKRYLSTRACYMPRTGEMYISPPYMFPPFFDLNAPIGFNYARLAVSIGHEISHALDYNRLKNILDCSNSTYKEEMKSILEEKKNCFVNEFDSYGINGTKTINENIADQQGISLAFKAMKLLINENTDVKDKKLPNFEHLNQEKLFFISYANKWCSNPNRRSQGNDVHSPNMLRVVGILRNMDEFANTFQCVEMDYMNGIQKCDLWSIPINYRVENLIQVN